VFLATIVLRFLRRSSPTRCSLRATAHAHRPEQPPLWSRSRSPREETSSSARRDGATLFWPEEVWVAPESWCCASCYRWPRGLARWGGDAFVPVLDVNRAALRCGAPGAAWQLRTVGRLEPAGADRPRRSAACSSATWTARRQRPVHTWPLPRTCPRPAQPLTRGPADNADSGVRPQPLLRCPAENPLAPLSSASGWLRLLEPRPCQCVGPKLRDCKRWHRFALPLDAVPIVISVNK